MAVLVRNNGSATFPIPPSFGGSALLPSGHVVCDSDIATVTAAFAAPPSYNIQFTICPSGPDMLPYLGADDVPASINQVATYYTTHAIVSKGATLTGPLTDTVPAPASAATTGTAASAALTLAGQAGGPSAGGAANNTGGHGSNDAITAGAGGAASGTATTDNTGGAGGSLTLSAGVGGAAAGASTANIGGAGGNLAIAAGTGGAGSGTGLTGGAGGNLSITAGSAGAGGNANAGSLTLAPGAATGTGKIGGIRNAASRNIIAHKPTAPVDATGGIDATVAQVLDASIFTAATSVSVTLPTAAGASGIVQALPGTPAVGDIIEIQLCENHASNTLTLASIDGTNTIFGIATITNGSRIWRGRITSVTASSESIEWY